MYKNCSKCNTKHLPPFGSYCKMAALVGGYTRDDPKYLSFLEDEFVRRKLQDESRVKHESPAAGLDTAVSD